MCRGPLAAETLWTQARAVPLNLSGQKRERPAALFRSGAANHSAGKVKEASRMYREASGCQKILF